MNNDFKISIPMTRDQREVMDKMTAAIRDKAVKAVSFRLFGTLMIFPFSEENDLFLLMEKEYGLKGNGRKSFADLRIEAETEAKRKFTEKCSITVEQIYDIYAKKQKISDTEKADLIRCECEMAEKYIFPRAFGKKLLDTAEDGGKNIVIIADTIYLRETVLRMMEKCKISGKLLLANEINSGEKPNEIIFDTILKKGKASASAHLHIGGDIAADVETPILKGAKALLLADVTANMIKSGRIRSYVQSEQVYDYDTAEFLSMHLSFGIYSAYIFDIPRNKTALSDFCGNPYILGFFVYGCGKKADISTLDGTERAIFDALSANPETSRGGEDFCELFQRHFGDIEDKLNSNGFTLPLKMLAAHGGSMDMGLLKNNMPADIHKSWKENVTDAPTAPNIRKPAEKNKLEKLADRMFPPGTKVRNIADGVLFNIKKKH